jgi:hypothetical protein
MKNPTLLQCFHWYYPAGGELWREVEALAPSLNEIGINMVWLPPPTKAPRAAIPSAMTPTISSTSASLIKGLCRHQIWR